MITLSGVIIHNMPFQLKEVWENIILVSAVEKNQHYDPKFINMILPFGDLVEND